MVILYFPSPQTQFVVGINIQYIRGMLLVLTHDVMALLQYYHEHEHYGTMYTDMARTNTESLMLLLMLLQHLPQMLQDPDSEKGKIIKTVSISCLYKYEIFTCIHMYVICFFFISL